MRNKWEKWLLPIHTDSYALGHTSPLVMSHYTPNQVCSTQQRAQQQGDNQRGCQPQRPVWWQGVQYWGDYRPTQGGYSLVINSLSDFFYHHFHCQYSHLIFADMSMSCIYIYIFALYIVVIGIILKTMIWSSSHSSSDFRISEQRNRIICH